MTDYFLSLVLNACQGSLKSFCLEDVRFWYRSMDALERHLGTLETVVLTRVEETPEFYNVRILTTCPRLKYYACGGIRAQDLVIGRGAERTRAKQVLDERESERERLRSMVESGEEPNALRVAEIMEHYWSERQDLTRVRSWVCLELELLEVSLGVEPGAVRGYDDQVFGLLSQLTKLRFLRLWQAPEEMVEGQDGRSLQLDLPSGLARLGSLKELEELHFLGSDQRMAAEDVQWILNQFPRLKVISSNFHTEDREICAELREMVEGTQREIEVDDGE
ncbi:hypothetical protein BGZ83_005636 [Gryganskiella cystojenkinii]|nr:hypothetical protein BGZ83_005636 [Gryganskiella cystojenkinii]